MLVQTRSKAAAQNSPSNNSGSTSDNVADSTDAIELIVPRTTPKASYWAPQRSVPSVTLGRILEVAPKLPDGPTGVVATTTLVLGRRCGVHGPCGIYLASLRTPSGDRSGLAVKLVDLLDLPVVGEINQAKAAKYLCTTFQASGMLEPVEGTIVPRFGGLFARGSLYCAVFEDAGRELTDDEVMDPKVHEELLQDMKEMHKHGVAASLNMDWKGVYRGQDGRIKITDGLYRRTLLTMTPEYLQDAAERDDTFAGWTREQMFQQLCKQANRLTLDVLEPYMDA